MIQKENVKEISKAYDDCEHEKYELQNNCQQMNDVVS